MYAWIDAGLLFLVLLVVLNSRRNIMALKDDIATLTTAVNSLIAAYTAAAGNVATITAAAVAADEAGLDPSITSLTTAITAAIAPVVPAVAAVVAAVPAVTAVATGQDNAPTADPVVPTVPPTT